MKNKKIKNEKLKTKMFIKTQNVRARACVANTDKDCDLLHDRPVFPSGRTPHDKQNHNCLDCNQTLVMSPKEAQQQDGLTDWPIDRQLQSSSDSDSNQYHYPSSLPICPYGLQPLLYSLPASVTFFQLHLFEPEDGGSLFLPNSDILPHQYTILVIGLSVKFLS
jgi:hypothetical protein